MISYISVKEAAELCGLSVRSVQMMCKQGALPGARKVSGIWLIPEASVRPEIKVTEEALPLHPENLYGRNTTVRIASGHELPHGDERGCTVTQYEIADGITLVFQDIHEEKLDYEGQIPSFPQDLIAIQHCREGRFEGEYPNGEYIYMGPGKLSVNLPAWAPVSNSFPLKHYHGLYIAILPAIADASVKKLEEVLGPLRIDFSVLSEGLSSKNRLAVYSPDEKTSQLIASVYPSNGEIHEEQLKLRVLELLQQLCARNIRPAREEQYFTRDQVRTIKEIRKYIIENADRRITLSELASMFRIPLTSMKSCFKGVYGLSIGKYLREYRMQAGAEMLISTELKIIEIAAALGYENAGKFSEAFASYYGMSPSLYRKSFCPAGEAENIKE